MNRNFCPVVVVVTLKGKDIAFAGPAERAFAFRDEVAALNLPPTPIKLADPDILHVAVTNEQQFDRFRSVAERYSDIGWSALDENKIVTTSAKGASKGANGMNRKERRAAAKESPNSRVVMAYDFKTGERTLPVRIKYDENGEPVPEDPNLFSLGVILGEKFRRLNLPAEVIMNFVKMGREKHLELRPDGTSPVIAFDPVPKGGYSYDEMPDHLKEEVVMQFDMNKKQILLGFASDFLHASAIH